MSVLMNFQDTWAVCLRPSTIFGCELTTVSSLLDTWQYGDLSWKLTTIFYSMDTMSTTVFCALLVDPTLASSARVSNLLKSKCEVVTVATGESALCNLLKKPNGITLVVTDINLPDMCSLEFVKIVEKETRLPIVMMCDTSGQRIIMEGLLSEAMLCFVKPLFPDHINDVWQLHIKRIQEVMLEPRQPLLPEPLVHAAMKQVAQGLKFGGGHQAGIFLKNCRMILESSSGSQRIKKMKTGKLVMGFGSYLCFMGQSSPFTWTPDLHGKYQKVIQELSMYVAPSARQINVSEITRKLVAKRLQRFHPYLSMQHKLRSRMVYPGATSTIAPNQPFIVQCRGPSPNINHELIYRQAGESPLTRFMRDPYCREQLKRIVQGSQLRWAAQHGEYAAFHARVWTTNNFAPVQGLPHQPFISAPGATLNTPPPPPPTPLMSVPIALAIEIERFIYGTLNAAYAQPGFMVALPERVRGDEEPSPSFLDELDTDDMYDAITELLDD